MTRKRRLWLRKCGLGWKRSRQAAAAAVESYPVLLHAKAITLRAAMPALVDVLGPQARTDSSLSRSLSPNP